MKQYPCKRVEPGKYLYRGYWIKSHGYYQPEGRVAWEAIDIDNNCCAYRAFSKREIKQSIDEDLGVQSES